MGTSAQGPRCVLGQALLAVVCAVTGCLASTTPLPHVTPRGLVLLPRRGDEGLKLLTGSSVVPNPGSFPQCFYLYVKCTVSAEQEVCHSDPLLGYVLSSDT